MPLTSLRCPRARTLCPLKMERLSWRRIPSGGHVIFAPFVLLSEAELGSKPYKVVIVMPRPYVRVIIAREALRPHASVAERLGAPA
jgi:hypothetical protein